MCQGGGRGRTFSLRCRPYGRHTDLRYQALHSLYRQPSGSPWRLYRHNRLATPEGSRNRGPYPKEDTGARPSSTLSRRPRPHLWYAIQRQRHTLSGKRRNPIHYTRIGFVLRGENKKLRGFCLRALNLFFAERTGFEPANRFCRLHAFQACLFNHSSTSPLKNRLQRYN